MAIAKDIPEVYLCEYDTDRESIIPYAGQKCIMANGDIYICITAGSWLKLGEEPTPSGFPYSFTPTEFTNLVTMLLLNRDSRFGCVAGDTYTLTITYKNTDYTSTAVATAQDNKAVNLPFEIPSDFPNTAEPNYLTIGDGFKINISAGEPVFGDYSILDFEFADAEKCQDFVTNVSQIVIGKA